MLLKVLNFYFIKHVKIKTHNKKRIVHDALIYHLQFRAINVLMNKIFLVKSA